MKRNITSKSRGRYLTPDEAAKYRAIREQIEREKPEINARIRAELEKRKRAPRLGPGEKAMDANHWENLVKQNYDDVLRVFANAQRDGMHEPVVVLIDPREGTARRFCLANLPPGMGESDVDRAIASASEEDRVVVKLAIPRQEMNGKLPPAKRMNPCNQSESIWVVCMEGTKVFATLASQVSHKLN